MRSSLAPLLTQSVGCQIEGDGAEGIGEGLKTVMLDDRAEASFNRAFYRISAQCLLRRSEEVLIDVDRGFHVWLSSLHIAIL